MEFPESVKDAAFRRSGGQCECMRTSHNHAGRCSTTVTRNTAEYNHIPVNPKTSTSTLANCEVLCVTCCREVISSAP
jgi:hypothetical protein